MTIRNYAAYSIGCAVVGAVLLSGEAAKANGHSMHSILFVFYGWVIGWVSATIARSVYPPPRSRKPVSAAA